MTAEAARGSSPAPGGKAYPAVAITVFYDSRRCRHFAECVRGLPGVFNVEVRPWIQPDQAGAEAVAEVVRRCPSGALHYQLVEGPAEAGDPVTSVTPLAGGPVLLRGALLVTDPATGESHSETRMALCSCGRTALGAHCDGACHSTH